MSKGQAFTFLTRVMLWQSLLWFGLALPAFSLFEDVFGLTVVHEYRIYGLIVGVVCITVGSLLKVQPDEPH